MYLCCCAAYAPENSLQKAEGKFRDSGFRLQLAATGVFPVDVCGSCGVIMIKESSPLWGRFVSPLIRDLESRRGVLTGQVGRTEFSFMCHVPGRRGIL